MDELRELMNVGTIRVTTEAALASAPQQADSHRQHAAQLLNDAEQRTVSPRVRAEIASLRAELSQAAEERDEPRDS